MKTELTKRLLELVPIMQGFLEGKTVQFRPRGSNGWCWADLEHPGWQVADYEYRIKPDSKTVDYIANVYPGGNIYFHINKTMANMDASADRIACVPVKVTYTEGEGL